MSNRCLQNAIAIGDIGTDIRVTLTDRGSIVDVSGAVSYEIDLTKPSGQVITKSASVLTDGSDGVIHYTTLQGDIDELGIWSYRGRVVMQSGIVFSTVDPQLFEVVA